MWGEETGDTEEDLNSSVKKRAAVAVAAKMFRQLVTG